MFSSLRRKMMTDYMSSSTRKSSDNVAKNVLHTLDNLNMKTQSICWKYSNASFYMNNLNFIVFMTAYFLIQVGLVGYQINYYINSGVWMIMARSFGILLSFNMVLMILLVARKTLTFLRNTRIGQMCLPFDQFTSLHKYIGFFILFLSVLHTFAHGFDLCNSFFSNIILI
jgi:hypothetical protein